MKKIALFPGSFDPITKGHVDIIKKSLLIFDQVVIGIGTNSSKKPLFTIEQRMSWINEVFKDETRLDIQIYSGLTIEFCKQIHANFIVRGLRSGLDFEYEQSIAFANKEMAIVTTEKDLVKIKELLSESDLRDYPWYVLPISVQFEEEEAFNSMIKNYVRSN